MGFMPIPLVKAEPSAVSMPDYERGKSESQASVVHEWPIASPQELVGILPAFPPSVKA
jgi:hypothetical protein